MLAHELQELKEEYATCLEAIQHQQLVIQKLESLLWEKANTRRLSNDAATDPPEDGAFSSRECLFIQVLKVSLKLDRARSKREQCRVEYAKHTHRMQRDLEELKKIVRPSLPPGVQVDTILRQGDLPQVSAVKALLDPANPPNSERAKTPAPATTDVEEL